MFAGLAPLFSRLNNYWKCGPYSCILILEYMIYRAGRNRTTVKCLFLQLTFVCAAVRIPSNGSLVSSSGEGGTQCHILSWNCISYTNPQ